MSIRIVMIVTIFFWKWVQSQRLLSHDLLLPRYAPSSPRNLTRLKRTTNWTINALCNLLFRLISNPAEMEGFLCVFAKERLFGLVRVVIRSCVVHVYLLYLGIILPRSCLVYIYVFISAISLKNELKID